MNTKVKCGILAFAICVVVGAAIYIITIGRFEEKPTVIVEKPDQAIENTEETGTKETPDQAVENAEKTVTAEKPDQTVENTKEKLIRGKMLRRRICLWLFVLLGFVGFFVVGKTAAQEDVADVPSQSMFVGGDKNKRYFLIGADEEIKVPEKGFAYSGVYP